MPGFDGTGPLGLGPMTGRGMGFCVVKVSDDETTAPAGAAGQESQTAMQSPAGNAASPPPASAGWAPLPWQGTFAPLPFGYGPPYSSAWAPPLGYFAPALTGRRGRGARRGRARR